MKAEPITVVYAKLENRPGTLEHATRVLGRRKLNIEAVSLETVGSTGFARFHLNRPEDALVALREAGVEAHASEALLVSALDKPGELGKLAGDIAAAGINVEALITTGDRRLLLRTSDNERAAQILKKI